MKFGNECLNVLCHQSGVFRQQAMAGACDDTQLGIVNAIS